MPHNGVYQPTTVGFEARRNGNAPNTPMRVFHKPRPQVALLLFALLALAAGVAMLASGLGNWLEAKEFAENENINCESVEFPVFIIAGGVFMTCFGVVAIAVYLKYADWRRNCVCPCPFFDKKQSLARQLQCQSGGSCGQGIMALNNPSTDPLVSHTQYAPNTEMPEERRNLMPNDNKDCLSSAEESEVDPRIVLRPTSRVEDA